MRKHTFIQVGVSLALAAGVVTAISTFAGDKAGDKWEAFGKQADRCEATPARGFAAPTPKARPGATPAPEPTPAQRLDRCFEVPNGKAKGAMGNYEISFKTKRLQEGIYKFRFSYRNYKSIAPGGDYKYHVTIFLNGKKYDEDRLPPMDDTGLASYFAEDLELKHGENRISIKFDNDTFDRSTGRDSNFMVRELKAERLKDQPFRYLNRSEKNEFYAEKILKGNNVNLWSGPKQSLEKAAKGECSPVPQANACTKLKNKMLRAIYEISKKQKFMITSLTTGDHTGCSNHYEGRAADIISHDGGSVPSRSLLDKFHDYGARELLGPGDPGHDGHLHAAWDGPHQNCE